ncbi:VOC family protein [Cystobacter fuscus]|uniref:VOC family protein n=1 Tax=Cystobacter fuscus TaxID=43 RepID=UPI0009715426|nr:VOC family protein [Cystobacter fuscus]
MNSKSRTLIFSVAAVFALTSTAQAQMPGIQSAGIDHVGITVPNLREAEKFFSEIFGCVAVTKIGPHSMTNSLSNDRKTQVPARAKSMTLKMLRCGHGSNIELFEYEDSKGKTAPPDHEDLGGHHIAFYTDDVKAGVAYLKSKGITVIGEPMTMTSGDTAGETWVHFLTPWGLEMELVGYPKGKAYEKRAPVKLWSAKHPAD